MDVPVSPSSFTSLCRLCLEPDQAVISIFKENDNGARELYDKISVCLPVKLDEEDSLPKKICNTCHNSVDFIYNFWQLSSNSEKQLLTMIGNFKSEFHLQESGVETDNSMIIYDTLEVKDVIHEDKELEDDENNADVEIKEVYFGEYLNQCDTIEDENTVLINEDNPIEETVVENNVLNVQPINPIQTLQSNNPEDIQISQIVESSNVSLRENLSQRTPELENYTSENELEDFKNSYNCHLCYKVYENNEDLQEHLTKMHRCFKCPLCQKTFARAANLRNHMTVHIEFKNVKCDNCGSFFKSKSDLRSHMKRVHPDPKTVVYYNCEYCDYKSNFKNRLDKHTMLHTGTYLHYCEECGRGFNHSLDLQTHLNNHKGLRPYQCEVCGKSFNRESYMKRHRECVHIQPHSYECAHCGKRFSFKYSMKSHIKGHLGLVTFHCCDLCGKQLSSRMSLRNHRRLHFDEKPFKCDVCEKRYATNGELKSHSFSHVEEKPFKCEVCTKTFRAAFMLKNHLPVHSAIRALLSCPYCDKKYYRSHSVKQHVRKHHPTKE